MHRFKASLGPGEALVAEVCQLEKGRSIHDALGAIYNAESDFRLGTDLLVLRLPVDQPMNADILAGLGGPSPAAAQQEFLGRPLAADAFERANDRPIYILGCCSGQVALWGNINPNYSLDLLDDKGADRATVVDQIREAELDELLVRSRALLTAAEKTVFRAPSGKLVRHFIRVGNIQFERDAIDAVSFWLLPHMRHAAAILTDTWSISSIAFNAARLAGIHFGGPALAVELLPDYLGNTPAAEERTRHIVRRLVQECETDARRNRVLCLISATQSGTLRERLARVAREPLGLLEPFFVAIYALGRTAEIASLRDLSSDERFALLPDDDRRDDEIRPVPIDPKVYFPLEFHDFEYALKKGEAEASKEVLDALARTGILRVHRTAAHLGRTRHHANHVETQRLPEIELFVERLRAACEVIERRPIAVVAAPISGCEAIGSLVVRNLEQRDIGAPLFRHPTLFFNDAEGLSSQEEQMRGQLRSATPDDSIVIVVDEWINDASLSRYQTFLRKEGYAGRIHYVVGIARPTDPHRWNKSAARLRHRGVQPSHTVTQAFELPMPDLENDHCPWCKELRLYQRWSERQSLPPMLEKRRAFLLASSEDGIADGFALELRGNVPMSLGPESFYVKQDSSQVDAYIGVSSALQRLRSGLDERPPLGPHHFPTATILKHEDYLTETWTDSVLRAVFLRAATIDELTYTGVPREGERTLALRSLILNDSGGVHDVVLEALLAVALGKAKLEIDEELRQGLNILPSADVITYMLDMIEADQTERLAQQTGLAAVREGEN